jgi:hypothetical protein
VANHQPRPLLCRMGPALDRSVVIGPAVNSHQTGLGHQPGGQIENLG